MTHEYNPELPKHLSYSQVSNLLQCGEKFRLTRVWGIKEQPGWALIGGSTVHEWTENYDFRALGVDKPQHTFAEIFERRTAEAEKATGLHRSEFKCSGRASKANPNKEDEAFWLAAGPGMCNSWVVFRENAPLDIWIDPFGTPGIELAVRLKLDGVDVVMYIDRVMVDHRTGDLVILDLKSGQPVKVDNQLGDYKVGLEQRYPGQKFRYGTYWYARTGATSLFFMLNEHTVQRAQYKYERAKGIRDRGDFIANPSMLCGSCGVKDFCYAVGGERSGEVRPPWVSMTEWEGLGA